jgi:hypothetical protein
MACYGSTFITLLVAFKTFVSLGAQIKGMVL